MPFFIIIIIFHYYFCTLLKLCNRVFGIWEGDWWTIMYVFLFPPPVPSTGKKIRKKQKNKTKQNKTKQNKTKQNKNKNKNRTKTKEQTNK